MTRPVVAQTRTELDAALGDAGWTGGNVAFVPTMGALHEGHGRLLEVAARHAAVTVASIFVNPLQFGPGEDYQRYPRTLEDDLALCARHGVRAVLVPGVDEMYPDGAPAVTVHPGPLGEELEGQVRPGHFSGVLTVVAKLLHLVRPAKAIFGEKDYQQLVLVRRMVRDLSIAADVVAVPTVRERDGLALSSRNRYLSPDQRRTAPVLAAALQAGAAAAGGGVEAALGTARKVLSAEPSLAVDYLVVRAPDLTGAPREGPARMLVAARAGRTRLIDNVPIHLGEA